MHRRTEYNPRKASDLVTLNRLMLHPLQQQLRTIGRRVRVSAWQCGLLRAASLLVGGWLLLGLIDFVVRLEDQGLRIIGSLLALAVGLYSVVRLLLPTVRVEVTDLTVAQQLERRFPELGQRLSSAVAFLQSEDNEPGAGSAALRRAVVHHAAAQVETLDLQAIVDPRPVRRAWRFASVVLLVVLGLFVWDASTLRIGVARLTNPFADAAWPRQHRLEFRDPPARLALGQPFEVELTDRNGELPARVLIHYRYQVDGRWSPVESEPMQRFGQLMAAGKERVTRSFQYRATGGDDQTMPWRDLEVVEPPRVESFRVVLHPAAYTGLPTTGAEGRIRAWRGTEIEITGTATKPLTAARLNREPGGAAPLELTANRRGFRLPRRHWTLEESGEYGFTLTSDAGLTGGDRRRWTMVAVPDPAPSVVIERPGEMLYATAQAELPVRILVRDNLAIRDVVLSYTRSDRSQAGEFRETLYTGPEQPPKRAWSQEGEEGDQRVVRWVWKLADLTLPPGTQLLMSAQASDYQVAYGQSRWPRRITIITAEELEDRLAGRQQLILDELARVATMQEKTQGQTRAASVQIEEIGQATKADLDRLQAAQLNQRQIRQMLADETDGLPRSIHRLLDDLDSNQVDSPAVRRQMAGILDVLGRLERAALPQVEQWLTTAFKTADASVEQPAPAGAPHPALRPLQAAVQGQDQVVAEIRRLLGDLSEWVDYRRFAHDVRDLQRQQEQVHRRTAEVATGTERRPGTLTKAFGDLSRQQRADLRKAALDQLELARRLDRALEGMRQMARQLEEENPLVATTLTDALDQARRAALSGAMRQASAEITQNRLGQAADRQTRIARHLRELFDTLANRREHELARLVSKLRQAEQTLAQLRQQQQGLRQQLEQAAGTDDSEQHQQTLQRLTAKQQQIQAEVERLARRLRRLQAQQAADTLDRAAEQLAGARRTSEGGDGSGAARQTAAGERDLHQAQQQLAQARAPAEADLAEEQLAQFADAVQNMIARQRRLLDDTQTRLAEDAQKLTDLAQAQRALAGEVAAHAERLPSTSVFRFALNQIAADMTQAVVALEQGRPATDGPRFQKRAWQRLTQLQSALDQTGAPAPQGQQAGGQGGQTGQGGQPLRNLAELKLVKVMQEDLNRRTVELENQGASPADRQRLAEEQGRLAELVLDLVQPVESNDAGEFPALELDNGDADLPELILESPHGTR